jgi:hypothetical protein
MKPRSLLCARVISEKAEQHFYGVNIGVFVEEIENCYFLSWIVIYVPEDNSPSREATILSSNSNLSMAF